MLRFSRLGAGGPAGGGLYCRSHLFANNPYAPRVCAEVVHGAQRSRLYSGTRVAQETDHGPYHPAICGLARHDPVDGTESNYITQPPWLVQTRLDFIIIILWSEITTTVVHDYDAHGDDADCASLL